MRIYETLSKFWDRGRCHVMGSPFHGKDLLIQSESYALVYAVFLFVS